MTHCLTYKMHKKSQVFFKYKNLRCLVPAEDPAQEGDQAEEDNDLGEKKISFF